MRLQQYLNETIEKDIQKFANTLMKKQNVSIIKIIFSNKQFSKGSAYYETERIKGGKTNFPKFIKIGEWDGIKKYPDQWSEVIGHELAHHIMNNKKRSLRHNKEFYKISDNIIKKLKSRFIKNDNTSDEKKRLKDKIEYWRKHKEEITNDQKTILNKNFNFEKEFDIMIKKYNNMK